jgi:hypothetical protein
MGGYRVAPAGAVGGVRVPPCLDGDADGCRILPLIPVPVTGIQPPRVRAVNDSISGKDSFAPKDLGALDSCDEHRNEGRRR